MDEGEYIDFNLYGQSKDDSIITSPLHLFFQEIEISVKVAPGEIWGTRDALDISRYVFNQYVTTTQIKNEIQSYIASYCYHSQFFQYDVNAEIMKIENKDFIYISVTIYDTENDKEFLQKFLLGQ